MADTVTIAKSDLRLLMLAGGYCCALFDDVPDEPDDRTHRDQAVVFELEDAGLLGDNAAEIDITALRAAVSRAGDLVLPDLDELSAMAAAATAAPG